MFAFKYPVSGNLANVLIMPDSSQSPEMANVLI